MSENLRKYTKALYMLDAVTQRVPADAWDNESCCDDWTARQAAGHAAWLIRNVGSLASGDGPIAEQDEAEVLGGDPAAGVRSIVAGTVEALDQQGALGRIAQTPFGEMPIDAFIGIVWVDPLTHAWDVADAAGIAHGIDDESAAAAHQQMQPMSDGIRGPGMFGEIKQAGGDDALSAYIAFAGRTSVRA